MVTPSRKRERSRDLPLRSPFLGVVLGVIGRPSANGVAMLLGDAIPLAPIELQILEALAPPQLLIRFGENLTVKFTDNEFECGNLILLISPSVWTSGSSCGGEIVTAYRLWGVSDFQGDLPVLAPVVVFSHRN